MKVSPPGSPAPPSPAPSYAANFRCIGAQCEDDCCHGWDVPVDKSTYLRYQGFAQDKLGDLVSAFVTIQQPRKPDALFAEIARLPSDRCAFFGVDRLCRIQKEYGPDLLSASCSIYPRNLNLVGAELEGTLSLSCPEAARNVLLDPGFLLRTGDLYKGAFRTDNRFHLPGGPAQEQTLFAVRRVMLSILRNRASPLRDRLVEIGRLCEHLEHAENIGNFVISSPETRMRQPPRHAACLNLILKLSATRVRDRSCGRRFSELYWHLIETVGSPDRSASGDELGRYIRARDNYLAPYLDRHPAILENYLTNYIFQHLFPFGRTGSSYFVKRSPTQEFILLAGQFIWLTGLLAGAAGTYQNSFDETHVVRAVQGFTRSTENYPGVLQGLMEELQSRHLDHVQAISALL